MINDSKKKLTEATQLLQKFIENNKQKRISLYCRLIYVQLLLSQAQKLSSIKQLSECIDADMLESTFGLKQVDSGSKSINAVVTGATKQKKKRKRKIRLPKKYDTTSKPDSERWLLLCECSCYRGKLAVIGNGIQGAVEPDQSATSTITTSTGAQKSMSTSKTTTGATSTQPKPTPPPVESTTGKGKGKHLKYLIFKKRVWMKERPTPTLLLEHAIKSWRS
ncbi:unnamed protein product [Rotaria sordida]|uniref:Signal recognition particle SRP72 subunit RNA-binding domain-containing protein n=1 Tax=Rotaria sordida TaxID=392033 RepID=A0A815V6S3_9BILA|nr:unnamed protein product [Rotaria sordida]CAF1526105.1 unnamed protein product [Rotaria sordida]